jgi:hypothetical protein
VAFLTGWQLLRRTPLGYLLTAIMMVFSAVLGAGLQALSAAQVLAKALTLAEVMGFVVPFVILTIFALWFTISLFRNFSEKRRAARA